MTGKRVTGLVVIGLFLVLFCYDLCAYVFGGNASTFSRVLGDAGQTHPMLLVCAGVLVGAFLVHVFALRQTVGDDMERFQVVAVAEVGAAHLDVFRTRCREAGAAFPGDDAVLLAVDAGGGNRQRRRTADSGLLGHDLGGIQMAVEQLPHPRRVSGALIAAEG